MRFDIFHLQNFTLTISKLTNLDFIKDLVKKMVISFFQKQCHQSSKFFKIMTNDSSNSNKIAPWIFAVGAVLLLAIGYLAYSNFSKSSEIDQKVAELKETETLRLELEEEYNQSIADLEDMRTSNEELNTLIEDQKTQLEEQRAKISGLLNDKSKLKSVRKELDRMKAAAQEYIAQVEALQAENAQLTETNTQLGMEKDSLNSNLQSQVMENAQLSEAQAVLTSEKTALAETNDKLNATVTLASVVKVKNIQVEGFKEKGNGKKAKKKSAADIDDLQVCFMTAINDVTPRGEETYFARLISPEGKTLAIEDKGAGVTKDARTGEQIKFTKSVVKGYRNQEMQICLNWQPSEELQKGTYQVEIYNKGYLAGKSTFDLK